MPNLRPSTLAKEEGIIAPGSIELIDQTRKWVNRQGCPATIGLLASLIAAFLISWFAQGVMQKHLVLVNTEEFRLWSLITYPWSDSGAGGDFIWRVFSWLWLYWIGGSIEREIGAVRTLVVFGTMTLVASLSILIGAGLLKIPMVLTGAYLPIAGMTVAWGFRNQTSITRIYGVIPVTGLVLAVLTILVVFFLFGAGAPILGAFGCIHLLVAYLFAQNKIPGFPYSRPVYKPRPSKAQRAKEDAYYEEVARRESARAEKERLRKLFEGSPEAIKAAQEKAEQERLRKLFEGSGIDDPDR